MEVGERFRDHATILAVSESVPQAQPCDLGVTDATIKCFNNFVKEMAARAGMGRMKQTPESTAQKELRRSRRVHKPNVARLSPTEATRVLPPIVQLSAKVQETGEVFESWPCARIKMTRNKKNTSNMKRQPSPPPSLAELEQVSSNDNANVEQEVEVVREQRTKHREDRGGSSSKPKAQPQKKQKRLPSQQAVKRKTRAYETPEDSDTSEDEDGAFEDVGDDFIKKPVSVDANGYPYGRMKRCLQDDVKLYARDLDPTGSWESVPMDEKERFFERLYADWKVRGRTDKINEKWIGPIITKVLIQVRWRLNLLINAGSSKPPEVKNEHWNFFTTFRGTKEAKAKSEQMRSISKGKGSNEK